MSELLKCNDSVEVRLRYEIKLAGTIIAISKVTGKYTVRLDQDYKAYRRGDILVMLPYECERLISFK